MTKKRQKQKKSSDLATFSRVSPRQSRRANFDAAVADTEVEAGLEEFTEDDEEEGDAIIQELVLAGDVEALEDILALTEEGLLEQVSEGELSQEEAETLYEEEVAYLEELFELVAESEGVPEEELLDEDEEDYDDEELAALAEEEGAALLEELEPEEIAAAFDYALEDLEADVDSIDEALLAGQIGEEEADQYYELAAIAYDDLADEYDAYMEAFEGEEYYEGNEYYDDPLVDHVEALTQEVEYQRRQNARMQAEFSSGQMAQDISDRLDYLERVGDELVQQGIMPPAVFEREFGVWANERDRFAGFSHVCQSNGTDPETELAHKERVIEMFADFAEAGQPLYAPGLMSYDEEFDDEELAQLDNLAAQARRNVRHLMGIN